MVLDHFSTGRRTFPADLVNLRFIYSLPGVSVGVQVRKNQILTNNHGQCLGLGHGGAPTTLTTKRPLLGSTAQQKSPAFARDPRVSVRYSCWLSPSFAGLSTGVSRLDLHFPYIPICVWGHNSHGSSSIHPIPLI